MTDAALLSLFGLVLLLLAAATAIGWTAHRRAAPGPRALLEHINARIRAWWVMVVVFMLAITTGRVGSTLLFALVSFLALREFVSLAPGTPTDHRTLVWCFYVGLPLEYALIGAGWYGLFAILLPLYFSMFVLIRSALAGDTARFLERTARIQWGLTVCVYFVGYMPALLLLHVPGFARPSAALLFFLVLVVELSDVLQFAWGKTVGRRRIAPQVSPNKTWEGFCGGILGATAVGTAIWWITPFTPIQAAAMAFAVSLMGFLGGLVMSAVKRDRGVKDFGALIAGHGGMLDRIDSLCFAAPVFFHLTRYFFAR